MKDSRYSELAGILIHYSTRLQAGERILIEAIEIPDEMVCALIAEARAVGAHPLVTLKSQRVHRALVMDSTAGSIQAAADHERYRMGRVQAYVGLRGALNSTEYADIPADRMKNYTAHWWKPVHIDVRVPETRWVVLRWPTPSMAQAAGMSTEAFEDFYFQVCTLDYSRMSLAMDPLVKRMEAADRVHITGPDTDLEFSIKGIAVVKCDGHLNVPDGEVFTAPVRESVNGVIHFNAPTIYQGKAHEDIRLELENGRIVKATGSDAQGLGEVLDTDEGARFIGEFALGVNPYITRPMKDILFDEKIMGSFHLTPGNAYDDADNGNRSEVHWDLVMIQTQAHGGGEIRFDGEVVRKDGLFVPEDLQPLNPVILTAKT